MLATKGYTVHIKVDGEVLISYWTPERVFVGDEVEIQEKFYIITKVDAVHHIDPNRKVGALEASSKGIELFVTGIINRMGL